MLQRIGNHRVMEIRDAGETLVIVKALRDSDGAEIVFSDEHVITPATWPALSAAILGALECVCASAAEVTP